jgi:ubiquinone/menaquinone biosynthesis C-methylase UbiE
MAEMFANAAAYEGSMGRWSARLAPLFVAFAQVKNGDRVLDVGCGTGSLVRSVADMASQSEIVGIDPSEPSIEFCRTKFSDPRITFDIGNAMDLPYSINSFDQTLSLLVFSFIPRPDKAAQEMRRVTRPGGTIAACNWDPSGLERNTVFWEESSLNDSLTRPECPLGVRPAQNLTTQKSARAVIRHFPSVRVRATTAYACTLFVGVPTQPVSETSKFTLSGPM